MLRTRVDCWNGIQINRSMLRVDLMLTLPLYKNRLSRRMFVYLLEKVRIAGNFHSSL